MDVWPSQRIGVRLSPLGQANDISDSDKEGTFAYTYRMLSDFKLAYLHVVEADAPGAADLDADAASFLAARAPLFHSLREIFRGILIVNSAYRSPEHNARVRGAKRSKHLEGTAFDISMANHDPAVFEKAARAEGFLGFGYRVRRY